MSLDLLIYPGSDTANATDYARAVQVFVFGKEANQCSPKTLLYYRQQLRYFGEFLQHVDNTDLTKIRRQHIELYLLEMRKRDCSPFTVRAAFTALRSFFNWCVDEEYLAASPLQHIKTPRTPKVKKPFLPQGAREALLKLCPPGLFLGARNAAAIQLMWTTGMRREECASLKLFDLDWTHGRIKVFGKGARERWVPFLPDAKKAVLRYVSYRRDEFPCLWLTEERRPLTLGGFEEIFKRLTDYSGLKVRDVCHCWRRTWAMRQLRAGIPIKQVQMVGGWESIAVLEGYVRAMESEDAMSANWK